MFPKIVGKIPPNHPILIRFSLIFTIHFGVSLFLETTTTTFAPKCVFLFFEPFLCVSMMLEVDLVLEKQLFLHLKIGDLGKAYHFGFREGSQFLAYITTVVTSENMRIRRLSLRLPDT